MESKELLKMKNKELSTIFEEEGLTFFTGVPDSTLKGFLDFLMVKTKKSITNSITHTIASSESEAVAIASGYYLATGKLPIVYMQDSGLANAVNPLTSLTNDEMFSIPMLLIIGWRLPKADEPQHKKMGTILLSLLNLLKIPYRVFEREVDLPLAIQEARDSDGPYALIVKQDEPPSHQINIVNNYYDLIRENTISFILEKIPPETLIISTTGKTSRELFETRIRCGDSSKDFYMSGSMGCASSIALGVALHTEKKVLCLDGDGSALMSMGIISTIGYYKPRNFCHVIFDNECHESTGSQPTVSPTTSFVHVALACGYKYATSVETVEELIYKTNQIFNLENSNGPTLIVIKIKNQSRSDLGRPSLSPRAIKRSFMESVQNDENR